MLLRLLPIVILALAFTGCASTQLKQQNEQLSARVTDLEKAQQAKDSEIVDLQYQVKDLSSKVEGIKPGDSDQGSQTPEESAEPASSSKAPEMLDTAQIVRVKVSPEKIQRALQAAGVYTGAIDGKIGSGTKEAIIEFQKSHGLKSDGVLGRKTWDELKTYLK